MRRLKQALNSSQFDSNKKQNILYLAGKNKPFSWPQRKLEQQMIMTVLEKNKVVCLLAYSKRSFLQTKIRKAATKYLE